MRGNTTRPLFKSALPAALACYCLYGCSCRLLSVVMVLFKPRLLLFSQDVPSMLTSFVWPIWAGCPFCSRQARKVGVCDAQTRDRVGPASELLDQAEAVHVYDHHIDKDSDIVDAVLHIEQ